MSQQSNHFDHSSLAATLKKVWGLQGGFLTKRDAWAATFEDVVMQRNNQRGEEECTKQIQVRQDKIQEYKKWDKMERMKEEQVLAEISRKQKRRKDFTTR